MTRILVIKLGALGDLVQAFAPFAAIRAHHRSASVTLLTTAPFAALMRASPWFDRVEVDSRPSWRNLRGLAALRRTLVGYDMVYDLQTSGRSSRYFRLAGRPAWSGIAAGAGWPHDNPHRDVMHTRARQRDQLRRAGIAQVPDPDLSWLAGGGPVLPAPYALLVPGAAPHRPAKRWPAERFGALACRLHQRGLTPVIVGTQAESGLAAIIRAACPAARDLTGRTGLPDLAGLAARAALAVGNDTGPMHLAAAMGCPATVLFSRDSDPSLTAPLGRAPGQVRVLRVDDLATLSVDRVAACLG
ncbi:glycosyl transferase family 9 [Gluconacetobacter diazotrophicus PA1 5]|uniref:Glycosyltransferase family 9 protein n=2 Tax=Gluconacetobacter diazotrophicus TaxID=33996 RepID=A0A7W4I5D7_GLUDI|nr:glycosyltransferase family 9 protein [Gluconacetobacter diazotrophicus]ACI51906.1 glycosyl transferase family 9 [Gluconacetobacter diazotrophicus PA1 5]MBB2155540.1 glycosyltransferase family 9 protein [Gluconacetobacter diazotrophicus]TWB11253.1 ADP-heptose:LPS heptosyltransferase [Gluconacetobacter diazotrophicus]CAP55390.1 putative glycosyl transferase [Gluconacetobacter diazotrophicus PA1 5]